MAVRLQMKLGVVAEPERLEDSPDTVAAVEPTIGATARSKGSLYVVVAGLGASRRLGEATRLVAEAIQGEYYYDESAGIVVCLEKAIRSANKRLGAQREKLALGPADAAGPVGVGVAVVRSNELYVVTAGPVEAYLVRQAHLLTLPDTDRAHGLPCAELVPHVWRGEITVGDSVVLVSSNITAKLGRDELKDAVVTLHPQSAMEHLHHGFVAAGGTGSDGAIAFEATEVSATARGRRLVPAHPPEPLAGEPDRSPIPLADSVGGGVAAVSSGASRARSAAGNALTGLVDRIQDLLPRRGTHYRRVTPAATKRETQRRAAIAVLAFVLVATALGVGLWWVGGQSSPGTIPQVTAAEKALAAAREDVRLVFDNGADLVVDDPRTAERLLTDALTELDKAGVAGVAVVTTSPLRARAVAGLDRLYGVVEVAPQVAFSFAGQATPFDLRGLVRGPDGAPYVLDAGTASVYRVDLGAKKAKPILRLGQTASGLKVGRPRFLAVGGPDVLVLDDKNVLWRWRPTDSKGSGTLARVRVDEAATWGPDTLGIGTFVLNADQGLYNLYVIDPSEQQILKYSPAADGGGFPGRATGYFTTPQDVSKITGMYVDGEVFLADRGLLTRFSNGQKGSWGPGDPGDALLRPTVTYRLVYSPSPRGEGIIYAYDAANARFVAFEKPTGTYTHAQYRIAAGGTNWADVRAFYVTTRANGQAPLLWWIEKDRLMSAALEAVGPSPSPGASASPGPSASPTATKKPTPKPTPKPTKKP